MNAKSITQNPAARGLVALSLLNLFFFVQILTLCPDLHHRLSGSCSVEKDSVAKAMLHGDVDLPGEARAVIPFPGRITDSEKTALHFSTFTFTPASERGPPCFVA